MGNNSSSKAAPPTPKRCTFCHKESCKGDSCQFFFGEVAGHSNSGSSTGVRYVSSYSSVNPVPVVRSTISTQQNTYIGQNAATHQMFQPGSTLQQGAYKATPAAQSGSISRPGAYSGSATTQSGSVSHPGPYTASVTAQSGSLSRTGVSTASATTQPGSISRPGAYTAGATTQYGNLSRTGVSTASATTQPGSVSRPGASTATATTQHGSISRPGAYTASATTQSGSVNRTGVSTASATTQPGSVSRPGAYTAGATTQSGNLSRTGVSTASATTQPGSVSRPGASTASATTQSGSVNRTGNGVTTSSISQSGGTYQPRTTSYSATRTSAHLADPLPSTTSALLSRNNAPESNKTDYGIFSPIPNQSKPLSNPSNMEQNALDLKWLKTLDVGVKPPVSKPSTCASIISKNSSNTEVVNETSARQPKFKHSPNAVKYEGVVFQILGSRNAKVRVSERNGMPVQRSEWGAADVVHKYAFLAMDKLINDESGTFYPSITPISDVLSKGDVLGLICTAHNNPSGGFQFFAHEAWCTGEKSQYNDADSVASLYSKSGSDTQESTSSKAKKSRTRARKNKSKEEANGDFNYVSDAVNQWLDSNQYCLNKNENSKPLKLIGGCHYIGKAIEIRPPYGFIVEITSKEGKQFVFVISNYFHPQGISAPALSDGTSLESTVDIGDEIVVIPIKNVAMQEGKFEWVASKAWPKNIKSTSSSNLNGSSKGGQFIGPGERLKEQKDTVAKKADLPGEAQSVAYIKSLYPSAKNWKEFDGEILTLQYNWGLVKEKVNNQTAYVFTRDNTYLFGASLQHFILDDVLKIGQQVKFAIDTGEAGAMNALAVWWGNKLPDFNSFDIATNKYCEENGIKLATEDSLIQHGKAMYLGH